MFAFVVHAWRSWKSAKAVGVLAVVALAAGIGSATAIYTVIDAVLVQPVPWQDSERFVALFSATLDSTSRGEWASTAWLVSFIAPLDRMPTRPSSTRRLMDDRASFDR